MACSARSSWPAPVPTTPSCSWPGWSTTSATASGPTRTTGGLGAERIRDLLGDRVAGLVEAHVPAKRYLVATDGSYRSRLSPESTRTLAVQGGALGTDELSSFLSSPYAADAVALRRADDAAKVPGAPVATLDAWVPVLRAVAARSGALPPAGAQPT